MVSYLDELKKTHNDDASLKMFNEIENALTEKKYGLLFEEHTEEVDELIKDNIPILTSVDDNYICKNPDKKWNFLIEGDNLQALYLLEKTHKGKIDVIYIDPPYNTGAHDWKYNNNYVGNTDSFRHSKWLSKMRKRLEIARRLLKKSGILICAIDHYELFQLGMLLNDIFNEENRIGVVSVVHKPEGRNQEKFFATSNEFALFYARNKSECNFQSVIITDDKLSEFDHLDEKGKFKLEPLIAKNHGRQGEDNNLRVNRPHKFYPIYVTPDCKNISLEEQFGYTPIYPVSNNIERTWKYEKDECKEKIFDGEILAEKKSGKIKLFEKYRIDKGELIKTHWYKKEYNANVYGTKILSTMLGQGVFDYPKSLYLIKDILNVTLPKDGIVLDFFAGSGTTMHAVNLLNAEDSGSRRCIMVTNNEISEKEEKAFEKKGICKGDEEWEKMGIARHVNWPRTCCSINGTDINGNKLEGTYIGSNISYSDGFDCNIKYFRCDWIPRIPEDQILSSSLCKHIKEMIELENAIEIDGKNNILIINKRDFKEFVFNNTNIAEKPKIWVNQNIIFNLDEMKLLSKYKFKHIPREFFGHELMEAAE